MNETDQEREMAANIYMALMLSSSRDVRSQQAQEWRIGISDLGYCSERTRRMLAQETPGDTDVLAAFIGTAIGDHAERAIKKYAYPDAILQADVTVKIEGPLRSYEIPGHPDLVIPGGILLDGKTSYGLSLPSRSAAADQQKRFQRHLYAKAAAEAGLFNVPLSEVQVGNFWIDRSAQDKWVLVNLEPYSTDVVADATEWVDSVVYDFLNNQESRKEPPREVCAVTCGFFRECRLGDTDVEGLMSDPVVLEQMRMYRDGQDLAREGRRLQDQAKDALTGYKGFALLDDKRYSLRFIHVNESIVPEHSRRGYDKIEFKEVK